ncbi:amidohydrolase [Segeticoccus rhizosphaerae]|uniref:amidohydrolase n=1 Tax=Segeticoccus rhizosphaerae TaxID=1104777 RepID=UPI001263F325|nr:amidohydrolase [Segeticoccus rhizosphaerae]
MTVLFRHPRIWTGDAETRWTTGLLVDDAQLVAVGRQEVLRDHVGPSQVVDLPGTLVIPGLHDAHIHSASLARGLAGLDLRAASSLHEALEMVRRRAGEGSGSEWLFGSGWNSNAWDGAGTLDRQALDAATPDRPTALSSLDGHTMWVNSFALRLAGITRHTPDPVGGRIERDAAGEPTGILRERAAVAIQTIQEGGAGGALEPLLRRCQEVLLSVGLTSITDFDGEDARAAYLAMRDSGHLALRVTKSVPAAALDAAIAQGRATGDGDDWVRVGPVKLFSDGALGQRTSHMCHDFHGAEGNRGIARLDTDQVAALTRKALRARIAVATHAIGDQANATVLDAYAKVRSETASALRLRIEHAQHLRPADVRRFAELGVVASMQPAHCTSDIDLVETLLPQHDVVSYGWRSLLNTGAALALGSDAPFGPDSPVAEPSPMFALYAAVTRRRPDGTPAGGWQPQERLTMVEALRGHTAGSAYADGDERRKGSLVAGKLADFVALDTDILDEQMMAHEPGRIHDTRALATVVGGEIRWQAG